jgi:hypothetical protein
MRRGWMIVVVFIHAFIDASSPTEGYTHRDRISVTTTGTDMERNRTMW